VVLTLQILPEQLRLWADSLPTQGCPSISNRMTKASEIDPLQGKILEAIRMNSGLQEITIAECIEEEGWIWSRGNIYVLEDDELRLRIIQNNHDIAQPGHLGRAKTFDLFDRKYYSKEMWKDVDQYVRNSHSCQRSRSCRHSTIGVLRPWPVPEKPWEDSLMHFVVGLPECEGFDAVWVVVDRLSKMRHFIPCHTTIDALGLAKWFLNKVVCLHGLPLTIVSDRGPEFASTLWRQLCSRLGIDWRMLAAFHPQTDG